MAKLSPLPEEKQWIAIYKGSKVAGVDKTTRKDLEMLEKAGQLKVGQPYVMEFCDENGYVHLKGVELPIPYEAFDVYELDNDQFVQKEMHRKNYGEYEEEHDNFI